MSVKLQLPPIENETIFSDLVLDLFNCELNTVSFQHFGKKGNRQYGIDIISIEQGIAIQCKKKELTRKGLLNELKSDFEITIREIRSSKTEIKLLIFVSTFHDSAELIEHLQQLKQKYDLPFYLTYRGWQSLQNSVQSYPPLLKRYFSSIYSSPKLLTSIPFFDPGLLLGRANVLKQLEDYIDHHSLLVLQGIGGIGKTVVVSSFISNNLNKFNNVIWIESHLASVKANILSQLSGLISVDGRRPVESWDFLLNELRNTAGTNLLVIDGVDTIDDETIRDIEAVCAIGWKVIITSRGKISDFLTIELEALSAETSFQLFTRYFKREINAVILKKILEKVDYHPLLIELLAKASNSNSRLTLEELYTLLLDDNLKDPSIQNLIAIGRHANKTDSTRHGRIFKYLLLCFKIFDLTANEKKQLLYFSVLPQTTGFSFNWYLDITDQIKKQEKTIEEIINALANKGWISIRKEDLSIHPLIQIVAREHLKITETKIRPVIMRCTFHLRQIEDNQAYTLSNYIFTARNIFNAVSINIETVSLTQFYAKALARTGDYLLAIHYLQECLDFCNQKGIDDPGFISSFSNNLGTAYFDIGRYDEAALHLIKAIDLAQLAGIEASVSLGKSMDNLASIFDKQGKHEEAAQLTKYAIQIFKDNEADEELGVAYTNLANTYCFLKRYNQAIKFSKQAYQLLKKFHDKNGLRFAEYYNTMGLIYLKLQKAAKANRYYKKILSIYERDKNPEDLSMAYSNIATTELMLNRIEDAKKNLDKAIELQESLERLNIDSYTRILQNLVDYYIQTGQIRQAEKTLKQIDHLFYKTIPEDQPKREEIKNQLRQLKQALPDPEQYQLRNIFLMLREQIDEYIIRSKKLITKFGEVKVLKYNSQSNESYLHDYMFFCFTRMCKTFSSVVILLKKDKPEDAMTLLFAVYRNYLMMAHLARNPESASASITISLMISMGKYSYIEQEGILEASQFYHPTSGKEVSVFPKLSSLLHNTKYTDDIIVHKYLGTYLSETAYSDFMMSGNYRNKEDIHYSSSEKNLNIQSEMLTLYLLVLSYAEIVTFINDTKETQAACNAFKKDLYVLNDTINQVTYKDEAVKQAMLNRLKILSEI